MLIKIRSELSNNQHLIAVSKKQPIEKITALHEQGQIHFGENYIQEALKKIEQLKHLKIKWHLIGPIQSNKVHFLKNNFEYIHSIDSLKIAELINNKAQEIQYIQKVFIQINLSGEATKSGLNIVSFKENWIHLKHLMNLNIVGLMTMPPLNGSGEENFIYFERLKKLADEFKLTELSMGTSHDYQIALKAGATWIRIGTLLFGDRT
jgi:PLP dependent protein